ncbi:unnamed protein product [Bemisia tabaci]|uniref:Uncharacterized protein n=1 Tax=Bemisia tabaci TaxID=7038 RepID=A0A9P0AJQ2_BEMTA|nr:unnamed protein product [Bemisia tabaci]
MASMQTEKIGGIKHEDSEKKVSRKRKTMQTCDSEVNSLPKRVNSTITEMTPDKNERSLYDRILQAPRTTSGKIRFLEELDNESELLRITESRSSFKARFVVTTYLLFSEHQSRAKAARQSSIENNSSDSNVKDRLPKSLGAKRIVPEYFHDVKSISQLCAIATFILHNLSEVRRRNICASIYSRKITDVKEIIDKGKELSNEQPARFLQDQPKEQDGTEDRSVSESRSWREQLVPALLYVSDLMGERTYSRLARTIDPRAYERIILDRENKSFKFESLIPYEGLINEYITTCVAPRVKDRQEKIIYDQLKVDPMSVLKNMIDEINADPDVSLGAPQQNKIQFPDSDTEYEVFVGGKNHQRKLIPTHVDQDGTTYFITKIREVLYDVIGTTGGTLMALPWSKRLELIHYPTKISLKVMSGAELNKSENVTLGVSMLEDGFYYVRHFDFQKKKQDETDVNDTGVNILAEATSRNTQKRSRMTEKAVDESNN